MSIVTSDSDRRLSNFSKKICEISSCSNGYLYERHLNLSDAYDDHFASSITSPLTSFCMCFTNEITNILT